MAVTELLIIQDLAIVVLIALAMALLFRWMRQPLLIGYIIAGMILGRYTPPFSLVHYPDLLNALAELGIVFLLFAVGLEYPIVRLRAVGRKAIVIALAESMSTFAVGFLVGQAFGFDTYDSLFIGLAISVTSTVIISSVLEDLGFLQGEETSLVLGIAVIEDVVTVSMLGVLQSTARIGHLAPLSVLTTLVLVVVFLAAVVVLGPRFISPLIDRVRQSGLSQVFLLALLGLAFGLALVSILIGISVATGAFLAGVLVAESKSQERARALMAPLKEVFGAIFFVSMGALMNIGLLPLYIIPIAAFLGVAVGVKFLSTYLAARRMRVASPAARRAALSLSASGGELSVVVAKGGSDVGATSAFVLPFIGALTVVTTLLAPVLIRFAWGSRPPPPPPPALGVPTAEAP